MNEKHRRTLKAIFEKPTRANIAWRDVEAMLRAAGGEVSEGSGSRVRVLLNGKRATFHRPHPRPEIGKSTVRDLQRFLRNAGLLP